MANGPGQKVVRGEPLRIRAADHNAWQDAAAFTKRAQRTGGAPGGLPAGYLTTLVRNDAGAPLGRFGIVRLGDPLLDRDDLNEFYRAPAFIGLTPTGDLLARFAVVLGPAKAGGHARALLEGITPVYVRMISEQDRCADALAGDTAKLRSTTDGPAQLLWVQPPGERAVADVALCIARLGPVGLRTLDVELTGAASDGTNKWRYDWREVRKGTGSAWTVVAGGYTSATHGQAYNGIERPNSGSGVQGNGVDLANLSGTFALKPLKAAAGTGVIVAVRGPYLNAAGVASWTFLATNMVDGSCP